MVGKGREPVPRGKAGAACFALPVANLAIGSDPVGRLLLTATDKTFEKEGDPPSETVTGVRRSPIGRGQADHKSVSESLTAKLGVKRSWHQ